jgi:hypothetical protein
VAAKPQEVAAEAGKVVASRSSVAVQLAAQRAKAWARMGDRRQVEVALDEGRTLLEALPYPGDLDNHFIVDPSKFDFYVMDCYRHVGEDRLAEIYAREVIRASTDFDGTERKPMRNAEARITLGSSPPAPATSSERWTSAGRLSLATISRCRRC